MSTPTIISLDPLPANLGRCTATGILDGHPVECERVAHDDDIHATRLRWQHTPDQWPEALDPDETFDVAVE